MADTDEYRLLSAGSAPRSPQAPSSGPGLLRSRSGLLVVGMLLAIVAIAALSLWDVRRRFADSMDDFGKHQERLARGMASNIEARMAGAGCRPEADIGNALLGLEKFEQPGAFVALLWPPNAPGFVTTAGKPASRDLLKDAIQEGRGYVRLAPEVAAVLGLPRRAAVAGLAHFKEAEGCIFRIAVVASALRASERAERAGWRALLGVVVAAGAVLILGGVALHWQRQELRMQQALAVEEARRRREAELERASRAATLGTLAMGITHELSTPLGIITARAEQLITRLQNDERAAHGVGVIQAQAERMGQVIRGILTLVRDQAPIKDRLSPADVCHGAMGLVRHRFAEMDIELRFDIMPAAMLPLLRGDQRLLEQALVNLLLNACDACPSSGSGDGQVELRVRSSEKQVLFSVTDNGIGISEEDAARAMEPFFTTKPVGKGAGLGLAVTHEIVKSHRGTLRIGPRPEGGTCAEIALPQAEENGCND